MCRRAIRFSVRSKNRWAPPIVGALVGVFLCGTLPAGGDDTVTGRVGARKKLIQLGWDMPDTEFLRRHWQQMEATGPFDGVVFYVKVPMPEGRHASSVHIWDGKPWQRQWFQKCIDDLKACRFAEFTDNFLRVDATPGTLAWTDDAAWKHLCEKLAICAWIAREGGAKGIAFDLEGYQEKSFAFDPKKHGSFAEVSAWARRRGAEAMRAIAAEYPNQTVLTLFLNSVNIKAGRSSNPEALLSLEGYGLMPAFVNGMLDAMPPEMTLVDGCENGYYKDGELEYFKAAAEIRQWDGPVARLIAPELRRKWRAQGQVGFGFYLDMYINPPGHRYYFPPLDGSRLKRLQRNLAAARDASDQYVWVYGEQRRWWGKGDAVEPGSSQSEDNARPEWHWETALPGITQVIRATRNPEQAARDYIAQRRAAGKLVNLIRNGDFRRTADGTKPADWGVWQSDDSKGRLVLDKEQETAHAQAVRNGAFLQSQPVRSGQKFLVEARSRNTGNGVPLLAVGWQKADGSWVRWDAYTEFTFAAARDDWWVAFGEVTVPEQAEKLVVLLAVKRQFSEEDSCWFDDVGLYPYELAEDEAQPQQR